MELIFCAQCNAEKIARWNLILCPTLFNLATFLKVLQYWAKFGTNLG